MIESVQPPQERKNLLHEDHSAPEIHIIRSAYRVMGEKGVYRVPLQEIADAAGVSKSVLLYYFKSKENLVLTVMRWVLNQIAERIRASVSHVNDADERIRLMIDTIFSDPLQNRRFYLTYIGLIGHAASSDSFGHLSATFRSTVNAIYAEVIKDGYDSQTFKVRDISEAATVIRAIIEGLYIQWLQEEDWKRLHAWYKDACLAAVLTYLTGEIEGASLQRSGMATSESISESG
ncbi:MAG: TetR/AcrR family transcriptional regulator [Actinomycetota bacterium]|nr:MAG: TetR/AcrR family transcriptional regulator [Actinomycetota bacterium]